MKTIILLLTFFGTFSCGRTNAVDPTAREVAQAGQEQNRTSTSNNTQLTVGPIEFFASWRGSYIKLERWKDTTDPKIPHPETFDILCFIENKGNSVIQDGDLIILTTVDSVVAPTYLHGGDVNKIIDEVVWTREAQMEDKMEMVPYLEAKGSTKVKIGGFKLGSLSKHFNGEEDTLWPWALRVNVHVLTRDMTQVAVGQATLPMIPSDRRLSAK